MADNISKYNESLSAAERIERGRKAGERSGEIRRENRRLKDAIEEHLTDADLNEIIEGLIMRAKKHSRDFEVLRDTLGQRPKDTLEVEEVQPVVIRVHPVPAPGEEWNEGGGGNMYNESRKIRAVLDDD